MLHYTTATALNNVKFGYGFICQNKTFKGRYTMDLANLILMNIPKHFHSNLCIAHTDRTLKNGTLQEYTYIAVNEHHKSAIWSALETAIRKGKAQSLRINADIIENPVQHPVHYMEFNDDLPW